MLSSLIMAWTTHARSVQKRTQRQEVKPLLTYSLEPVFRTFIVVKIDVLSFTGSLIHLRSNYPQPYQARYTEKQEDYIAMQLLQWVALLELKKKHKRKKKPQLLASISTNYVLSSTVTTSNGKKLSLILYDVLSSGRIVMAIKDLPGNEHWFSLLLAKLEYLVTNFKRRR